MRYLIFLLLIPSCSNPKTFIDNCYKPFILGGRTVKVTSCSKSMSSFNSYCIIKVKSTLGDEYYDTIQLYRLEDSIQVSCEEY